MQLDMSGAQTIEVSECIFGGEFSETLMHRIVMVYMAGGRQGSKAQKIRSEVSGSGRRPWRQKGTGRAHAGTIRSPIWRGDGTTFVTKPYSHEQKLNRKVYHAALRSIPAELVRLDHLVVVTNFTVDTPKTEGLITKLNTLGLKDMLIVTDDVDGNPCLVTRNLTHVDVRDV